VTAPEQALWPDGGVVRSVQGGVAYGWQTCEVCDEPAREVCPECGKAVFQEADGDVLAYEGDPFCYQHDEEVERCRTHAPEPGRLVTAPCTRTSCRLCGGCAHSNHGACRQTVRCPRDGRVRPCSCCGAT
jgi:hypothetical protein